MLLLSLFRLSLFRLSLLTVLLCCFCLQQAQAKSYTTLEWVELIPEEDLLALQNPPDWINNVVDGGVDDINLDSMADSVTDAIARSTMEIAPEDEAYFSALQSVKVKDKLDKLSVRIPGFIVPVEFDDNQVVTEFFLVPYFGACIHVPPPPPNQVIYVSYPQGLQLEALYDPFWIEGKLSTTLVEKDIAVSAYSIKAEQIKDYEEWQP